MAINAMKKNSRRIISKLFCHKKGKQIYKNVLSILSQDCPETI
jgi:hypothetical protein